MRTEVLFRRQMYRETNSFTCSEVGINSKITKLYFLHTELFNEAVIQLFNISVIHN